MGYFYLQMAEKSMLRIVFSDCFCGSDVFLGFDQAKRPGGCFLSKRQISLQFAVENSKLRQKLEEPLMFRGAKDDYYVHWCVEKKNWSWIRIGTGSQIRGAADETTPKPLALQTLKSIIPLSLMNWGKKGSLQYFGAPIIDSTNVKHRHPLINSILRF